MLQELIGQVYVPSYDLTVNATAKATTAGTYFVRGYSAESTAQLLEHVEDLIQSVYAGATVTYSSTTGLVTIALGTTGSITWDDTALRDILGFTANLSSVTEATATNPPKYIWRPSTQANRYPHELSAANFWVPSSDTIIDLAENGTTYALEGKNRYAAEIEWYYLAKAEVLTPTSGNDSSFQRFWLDVPAAGGAFRLVFDRTSYTSTGYVTAMLAPQSERRLGSFDAFRRINAATDPANAYWDLKLPLVKYVQ